MADVTYTYSISDDFPDGAINSGKLDQEIRASSITIALRSVSTQGDIASVTFGAALPSEEQDILDGGITGPAGGLIAAHDNSLTIEDLPVKINNVPSVVSIRPPTQAGVTRSYSFSIDWTKKETWHYDAFKVINEVVGVGDGTTTEFKLAHGGPTSGEVIVNLTNGLVTDEQFIFADPAKIGGTPEPYPTGVGFGYGYSPLVLVDSGGTDGPTPRAENNPLDPGSTGQYIIDHINGTLNFLVAPGVGHVIIATYWYVPDDAPGTMVIKPPAGKQWDINTVEAQFSKNLVMNDIVLQNQYVGNTPVYPMNVEYRRMGAFYDYTFGSYPEIPPLGGPLRGYTQPVIIMRWEFGTTVNLNGNNSESIRCWLKNGIPFGGERATLTWYLIEKIL